MRAIWTILMVVLAALTASAQLDRASRRQPSLAAIVPPPMRTFAQERTTMATVRSAPPAVALAESIVLTERSPLPAEHLTLLSIARERSGDRVGSGETIQRAAQRGWRDPIAQQVMFEIALSAGDRAEASRRLAALIGTQEEQAPIKDMTKRLLSVPEGRKAMASALVGGGNWTRAFLSGAASDTSPAMVETVAEALRGGAKIECRTAAVVTRIYQQQNIAFDPALFERCTKRRV
ncbi:hypothetical protein [Novosphingobium sp.]|uniref:hypothetical protein n=1 Tax=Novosphingobium sp. TaxID=1874826 RepID=UPI002615B01A|nr:hypothetical protein [Novosphingobium sp.]